MRTVAVASGKGGTGKTTLTALFAHLASRHMTVAVADGDVEASNLPLALHAETEECFAFTGGETAAIDPAACIGCGLCARVCRFDAIAFDLAAGAFRVDPFACEGCRRCAYHCPSKAVTMLPSTAGEACVGRSSIGPIAFGQLGPGEDLSGRLVTEVRRLGADAADHSAADVLLIDGPPGIGCPLTAAVASTDLVVAVAEPTVSGAHDLERLIEAATRLGLPVRVVLNKADLSDQGAERVRTLCSQRDVPLVAEIPFDPALAGVLSGLAAGDDERFRGDSPGMRVAAVAWSSVAAELALPGL
ncbi:MAG: ATP-binding protein [Coriobacteriales bacterium]